MNKFRMIVVHLFMLHLLISFKIDSDGDTLNEAIKKFKY